MAPTGSAHCSKDMASAHKLRKPMVEKLRRDRINSSIEQLKSLLGPEFLRQQPDSKQEKADVLEMTVAYLQAWQQQAAPKLAPTGDPKVAPKPSPVPVRTSGEGYTRCVQEAVSFLSHCELQTQAHRRLLGHFQGQAPGKPPVTPTCPMQKDHCKVQIQSNGLWRPW
ncbi:transcription factor HES-5-like [Boleophthalmus pectinirostris]|uniref:transcription factor HES-5-like n=1 Tax=Boleophthalmus pectinirostris TaxID=150288 RepID=UPI00242F4693|nr:transcription factor HES-5-like [Boleophthalmus pectinirostris]